MRSSKVAWIGRLTGPKGSIAKRLLSEVIPRFPQVAFTFVGGPLDEATAKNAPANLRFTGFVPDVAAIMREQDVVIGGGRVPLEAMRLGVPVIAVGESCYVGPIDGATIARAKASNFGDCAPAAPFDADALARDLEQILSGARRLPLAEYPSYLKEYEPEAVYRQMQDTYREALIDAGLGGYAEVPVLAYHRVVTEPPVGSRFNVYVTTAELERQLASLKARGFETLTFRDIANGRRARKPVVLTFDDGYADNHDNLLPLLARYDARAIVFVLGDRSVRSNVWDAGEGDPEVRLMTDAEVRACHASGHIEIGSHGLKHRHLPSLSEAELEEEMIGSKRALEALIGAEVASFAYPYGDYGAREAAAARRAGYLFGIGTITGPTRIGADRYRIRRIQIFPHASRLSFWKKTSGYYLRYRALKDKPTP